jgi:hypothetical protein
MIQKLPKSPPRDSGGKSSAAHAWASVERQLVESRVRAGSALENLIRNNQEISMLRPEEAHDSLPFPPWLRVYWRKSHPELDFSGPRVGYPLILNNLWNWMMRNQDLPKNSSAPANHQQPVRKPTHRS